MNDGTAFAAGVVDVYPAAWSIARGEPITLKVRSTTSYSVHVFRLGWYGSLGSREVATVTGRPADPQPYPSADPVYGRTDASWHDTDVIPTDSSWTPGVYVARIVRADGLQAATYVVIRDDGSAVRAPILLVIGTATDQAYNGWPGMDRGGKSLYGFNSSAVQPEKSVSSNQAVIVSNDRPYLVGFGLGDVIFYEYPFIRWLEGHGYDVAYAIDQDLQFRPDVAKGRKVISESGHAEYWSRPMRDTVTAARDEGTNLLLLTGDTISWQVRFEDGGRTMIGYKESWVNDPEQLAGVAAWNAGDQQGAQDHFAIVSRGWASVGDYPKFGLTAHEPGMTLVGLHSGGAFGPNGPWGDLIIEDSQIHHSVVGLDPRGMPGEGGRRKTIVPWIDHVRAAVVSAQQRERERPRRVLRPTFAQQHD
ncbi:MAG: N,N-dimethylformamidase beta subunit family domain-containing protein, partial [Polyangiales bacterium]